MNSSIYNSRYMRIKRRNIKNIIQSEIDNKRIEKINLPVEYKLKNRLKIKNKSKLQMKNNNLQFRNNIINNRFNKKIKSLYTIDDGTFKNKLNEEYLNIKSQLFDNVDNNVDYNIDYNINYNDNNVDYNVKKKTIKNYNINLNEIKSDYNINSQLEKLVELNNKINKFNSSKNKLIVDNTVKIVENNIIKNIWQTHFNKSIQDNIFNKYRSWEINTDWDVYLYNNTDINDFIEIDFFKKLRYGNEKINIWKYYILYKYGGFYSDINKNCNIHLNNLIPSNAKFVAFIDKGIISTSSIYSDKNHIIFKYVINTMLYILNNNKKISLNKIINDKTFTNSFLLAIRELLNNYNIKINHLNNLLKYTTLKQKLENLGIYIYSKKYFNNFIS